MLWNNMIFRFPFFLPPAICFLPLAFLCPSYLIISFSLLVLFPFSLPPAFVLLWSSCLPSYSPGFHLLLRFLLLVRVAVFFFLFSFSLLSSFSSSSHPPSPPSFSPPTSSSSRSFLTMRHTGYKLFLLTNRHSIWDVNSIHPTAAFTLRISQRHLKIIYFLVYIKNARVHYIWFFFFNGYDHQRKLRV